MMTEWRARTIGATMLALGLVASAPAQSNATMVIRSATDSGSYNLAGTHNPTNVGYIAGNAQLGTSPQTWTVYRNFLTFDLSGITDTITGAVLRLYNPTNGYWSPGQPTETFELFDVSTSITELTAGGSGKSAIYADLGSGTSFGSRVFSSADNNTIVEIVLNSSAIAALEAARGSGFAIGGAVTSLDALNNNEYVFGATGWGTEIRELVLTTSPAAAVPEPSTLASGMVAGLVGLGYAWRRRKQPA